MTIDNSSARPGNQYFSGSQVNSDLVEKVLAIASRIDTQKFQEAYFCFLPKDYHLYQMPAINSREMLNVLVESRQLWNFLDFLIEDREIDVEIVQQFREIERPQAHSGHQQAGKKNPEKLQKLPFYLQVVVEPKGAEDFLLKAWLKQGDARENFESLNTDEAQLGDSCHCGEIEQLMGRFLDRSLEFLVNKKYDYELTLEIFLPSSHLGMAIDRWGFVDPLDDLLELGVEYKMVVRSSKRLNPWYIKRYSQKWLDNWRRVSNELENILQCSHFEPLQDLSICDWDRVKDRLGQDKLGLRLNSSLDANKASFFDSIEKSATPIAIWARTDLPNLDLSQELDSLLIGLPLGDLPSRVHQKRRESLRANCRDEHHLGSHIALLWEDPYRLTPDLEPLRSPGT